MHHTPPAWHPDPHDPGNVRLWDGAAWSDETRPALVHYAEQQVALTRQIAADVRTTKAWVTFLGVLVLFGLLVSVLFAAGVVTATN